MRFLKRQGFQRKEASDIVEIILNTVKDTLHAGETVKIAGLGILL